MTEEELGSTDETLDPPVQQKPTRSAFKVAYKLSSLEQTDECQGTR